ncbi:MAG: hypothetical protein OEQ14_07515 [Gammaproteobacteria bacterium]|nr:hypothetical protein [Gammaproteobacteria bacterium]
MVARRAFYVTQDSLAIWHHDKSELQEVEVFPADDTGLRRFDAYLAANHAQPCFVLMDVIEEEFAPDTIPRLGMRDRAALTQRRLQRKFPGTPYRLPVYQGRKSRSSDEAVVVHSAISNNELLDPWLQIILRHEVALTGIFSVPLLAPDLLGCLRKTALPALLITQHQSDRLRQAFMQNGQVQSARLSQCMPISDEEYPQFVLTEIGRSRRYLERTRLLSSMEQLDVYIVADSNLAERILACAQSDSPLQIHFIKPEAAAKRVGIRTVPRPDNLETLYLATSFRRRPKHSYAVSGEERFWRMRRLRGAIIGVALSVAAACSVASGLHLSEAWLIKRQSAEIDRQYSQLSEAFRRENERLDPIEADSHEMKLAVDTGDFILSNRLPVPWVMQQLGFVMGNYPDVRILTLNWSAESAALDTPSRRQRGDEPMPVPVPGVTAINASVIADIAPFDGDMRKAFARIDELVEELEERTAFSHVVAVEYPLDARPQSSISGEIVGKHENGTARFRLQLRFPIEPATENTSEASDESV